MAGGIIDPTGGSRESVTTARSDAPRPDSLDGLRVGLLENGKRNAAQILDAVGEVLVREHGAGVLVRRLKKQFAMPLPDELLEDLVNECDVVVLGVGDCGSCSASAVADGIALETAGTPSAVICTEAFEATSTAMAELKGDPGYPFLLTGHPVANLTDEQIVERARELAGRVADRLAGARARTGVVA
ncbi:UGSC family (seleno)protein [Georgenia halophila]|uniref:UGSC family (Seleno)protein n=1 Tax=Georgenia halophila TaxID=620889 RepID=A0ABP8KTR4_9MICO